MDEIKKIKYAKSVPGTIVAFFIRYFMRKKSEKID